MTATEQRIRAHLGKQCVAGTLAGLRRYVAGHPGCLRGLWGAGVGRQAALAVWQARRDMPAQERERRRCAGDREYRRRRLAGLRRECRVSAAAYSPERWEVARLAEGVARALGLPARAEVRDVWPCSAATGDLSYTPTAKDSTVTATLGVPARVRVAGSTEWDRKGRPHYTRASDDSWVLSALRRRAGGRAADYYWQEPDGERETYRHELPVGWRWECDANGPRIVAGPDDYHPNARELRGGTDKLRARLVERAETRRRWAAQSAAERADVAGVLVCLADSVRAGNCRQGSLAFARRHGLDARRHYGAAELLDAAGGNGDLGRVRLAIRAAVERTRRESEAGLCVVAEHAL